MSEEKIMENKWVFNNIILDYEMARPGYPIELFEDVVEYSIKVQRYLK